MPTGTTGPLPPAIGPYIITGKIGSGGMATVYRAYHPQDRREVALKVLAVRLADDEAARIRFEREARALMQFSHPHILPVYDFGHDGDTPYLTMRLMSGRSLDDLLHGHALPLPLVGRVTRQIASALDYAHARGIIHRDVKPENILLDEDNTPYLADFGVAYFAAYENQRLTTAGAFIGTVAYASPEQCEGKPLDRPSDIYSLAIMVFEMATGRLPFEGSSPLAVMKMHLHEPVPNPLAYNSGLPIDLYDVLSRGLAKLPEHRYTSAMKFSEAVDHALGLHAIPEPATSDEWLFDDITPVDPDGTPGAGDQWVPPDEPALGDILSLNAPARAPTGGPTFPDDGDLAFDPLTSPADPFAGITPASFGVEALDAAFDDSFDLDLDFETGGDAASPEADEFPPPEAVLGAATFGNAFAQDAAFGVDSPPESDPPLAIRPIGARPVSRGSRRLRRPIPWLRIGLYGTIVVSLLAIGLAAVIVVRDLFPPPVRLDATYDAGTLGLSFEHPSGWTITPATLAVLSAEPTGTILLSDAPIAPGTSMGDAALVIAVQRIDAAAVFRVPPACQPLIDGGPQPTFACMERQNYSTPVHQDFDTPRARGVKLPGVLPPTRASLPVVLLPGGHTWVAVIVVYWNRYDDAQDLLDRVARSVRVRE